jgi:hypothetical protein
MFNQVDIEFVRCDKTQAVADILGMKVQHVAGHILDLWSWAMKNAPDGDLTSFPPRIIARAAGWDGDPEQFIAALVDGVVKVGGKGYIERIDTGLYLHEWFEYGGKLHAKRAADAERKRAEREQKNADSATETTDNSDVSDGRPSDGAQTSANVHSKKRREEIRKESPQTPQGVAGEEVKVSPSSNFVGYYIDRFREATSRTPILGKKETGLLRSFAAKCKDAGGFEIYEQALAGFFADTFAEQACFTVECLVSQQVDRWLPKTKASPPPRPANNIPDRIELTEELKLAYLRKEGWDV